MRRFLRLGLLLLAVAAVAAGAAPAQTTRGAASSGSWVWGSADHTRETVKLMLDQGACQLLIAPEARGIEIDAVSGPVELSSQSSLPHPFVGLDASPAVGPNGTLQFTLQTNVALPATTTISIEIYPQCNSSTGLEQVNATNTGSGTTTTKKTPNLDDAAGSLDDAIAFERKADVLATAKHSRHAFQTELAKARGALNAASHDLFLASIAKEAGRSSLRDIRDDIGAANRDDGYAGEAGFKPTSILHFLALAQAKKEAALALLDKKRGAA